MRFQGPDAHGWFSIGLFLLTALVLGMIYADRTLASVPLFATLAQAIVITGLINGAVSFFFGASKTAPKPEGGQQP